MMKIIIAIIIIILLVLLFVYYCFCRVFAVKRELTLSPYKFASTRQHKEYKEQLTELVDDALELSCEEISTVSFDGLKLYARLYMLDPGAPFEILCHGYRDNAVADFCFGLKLVLSLGHNVILIDQRAHGKSEGKSLSFGILERKDVISWIEYVRKNYGEEKEIILYGISMGAATVLMASELDIEPNVKGIIADCGYASPEEIIYKVINVDLRLPAKPIMPFVRLSAKLFGGFGLADASAAVSAKHAKAPVLFIHGEADEFVPIEMDLKNYMACSSQKTLFTVPGAGHGLSFLHDKDGYSKAVTDFVNKVLA